MAHDLDVCIAARNEEWLEKTLEDCLAHSELDTRIIVVLDGYWPLEPLADHPRVTLIHHTASVGQRAGYNEAVALSRARFVAKFDAHTAFDQGWDRKLIAPYDSGVLKASDVTVPLMFNLHVFDWVCERCGRRTYQGPTPTACGTVDGDVFRADSGCGVGAPHRREVVWRPRPRTQNDLWWFDKDLHVWYCTGRQYRDTWKAWRRRADKQGEFVETMACMGNGWLMTRERHHALGGLDEGHGSWGQVGVEVGCKAWLSGGRLVTNRNTWFAHLFRTRQDFGFPYPISGNAQDRAKEYSRWLWRGGHWAAAKRPLSWLVDYFAPVPTWGADIDKAA